MDEYTADQALLAYERMEGGLAEFSKQIPAIEENEAIKSPLLISYIVDACGLLDSLLRDLTTDPVTVNHKTKRRKDCDIQDFATLHATNLDLPDTRTILLVSPPRYRNPFGGWKDLLAGGAYKALDWWQDYNLLKHDRLAHMDKGTFATALNTACALHQVIARRLDLVPILLRRGWFPTGQYVVDYVLDSARKGRLPETFIVQTRLFATPVGKEQFPPDLSDIQPGVYQCKPEFIEFLGKSFV